MTLTLATPPASEPITLAEAKAHLIIDDTDEDALIASLIVVVRKHLDGYSGILGRALISQEWDWRLAVFSDIICPPLPPLISVTSVKYFDTDGAEQTVETSIYRVEPGGTSGGLIELISGQSWPSDLQARSLPIIIRFKAGYGTDWNSVPDTLRHAMLILLSDLYEGRESLSDAESFETPVFRWLTNPYKFTWIA